MAGRPSGTDIFLFVVMISVIETFLDLIEFPIFTVVQRLIRATTHRRQISRTEDQVVILAYPIHKTMSPTDIQRDKYRISIQQRIWLHLTQAVRPLAIIRPMFRNINRLTINH